MKKKYHTLWEQWTTSALTLNNVGPLQFLIPITQGLGKIDAELREWEAENLKEQSTRQNGSLELKMLEFNDKLIQSHLWVLGIYEVIRTLSQKTKNNPQVFGDAINQKIAKTKHDLEIIRIPLAKLEPRRLKDCTALALPVVFPDLGFGWRINSEAPGPEIAISRQELADEVLDLLTSMRDT
jgi:hypothetical protein